MTPPPRSGIVWRLYAIGVVQFALVLLSALGIAFVLSRLPARWDMPALSARLKPFSKDRAALARELTELRNREHVLASLYDAQGKFLLGNVTPPLRPPGMRNRERPPEGPLIDDGPPPDFLNLPPPPPPGRPPRSPGAPSSRQNGPPPPGAPPGGPDTFARFDSNGEDCLLVVRFDRPRPSALPFGLTLLAGLVVLGVGATLTARWIARPLSRLSRVAASLGRGELGVRSELQRNDELGDLARAFDDMAARVQGLLQNEKELLANVAHELRTPLSRIRVALELASEGDNQTARASLAEIALDLGELETLIDDVLTAARFEPASRNMQAGGFALRKQVITARSVAERAAERFRAAHPHRPFSTELPADEVRLDADPVLLRRVIDNLLENAHKYSPDPQASISIALSLDADMACFTVRDGGAGIAAEDLPQLFTPFFRGERSRSRGTGGVGLGLTLVKRILEAHGGRVAVDSELGRGSTFRACLPVHAETLASSDRASSDRASSDSAARGRPTPASAQ